LTEELTRGAFAWRGDADAEFLLDAFPTGHICRGLAELVAEEGWLPGDGTIPGVRVLETL